MNFMNSPMNYPVPYPPCLTSGPLCETLCAAQESISMYSVVVSYNHEVANPVDDTIIIHFVIQPFIDRRGQRHLSCLRQRNLV